MNRRTHLDKTVMEEHNGQTTKVRVRAPEETERLLRLSNNLDRRRYFGYDRGKGRVIRVLAISSVEAISAGRVSIY